MIPAWAWAILSAIPMLGVALGVRLAFRAWIRLLFAARGFDVDPFSEGRGR